MWVGCNRSATFILRMKKNVSLILLSILVVFFYATKLWAEEYPWRERINKDGISVSTRKVEASPILEFKADVTVSAPINQVIALFENEKRIPEWYYQCVQAELIRQETPEQKIFYFVLHLPWPVTERDSIFRRVRSLDAASGVITYTASALADQLPQKKGKIRVPYIKTVWRFTPLADGKTEIYFQQHSDPGGSIPGFLANALVVDIPFNCLKNFRSLLVEVSQAKCVDNY